MKLLSLSLVILSVLTILFGIGIGSLEVYADPIYRIALTGDISCASNAQNTINQIINQNPALVLWLGDLSYVDSNINCFISQTSQLATKDEAVIGNHDDSEDGSSASRTQLINHFGMPPNGYYSKTFDVIGTQRTDDILLIGMDSQSSISSTSSQYSFVENSLKNSNSPLKIVMVHKPFLTCSCHHSSNGQFNTYHALFKQYGVDLVLQAHNHNIQYFNTLDNVKYIVSGAGGRSHYSLTSTPQSAHYRDASSYGFTLIDADFANNELQGKFITNTGTDVTSSHFIHSFFPNSPAPPVANNQAVTTTKNTAKSITLTATDPNNDLLTYSIVTQPSHGTISGGTGAGRTYTPAAGYVGPDSFTFKASDGTFDSNIATVSITVQDSGQGGGYNYAPGLVLTGSNYQEQPSSPSLQLSQFSVAAWFKTSTNFGSDAFIVNKGGIGSDSAGQNMNYGIWMTSSERIKAGFETSSGADQFVTSVNTYNDNQWHYAIVTNDGSTVRLYIDGVQVATKSTAGASPESSGTKPVRVGANSRVTPPGNFFTGEVDEVRVWNDDLTAQQVSDAFAGTSFNTGEQVLHLPFGSNSPPVANNQAITVNKNTQQPITLTATDPNNDPLTYTIVTPPENGTLSGTAPNLTYNPNLDHVGPDSFTFKANDGTFDSNIATVSITVQNGPPVANNQAITVNKNTQQPITLTATDPNNDPLTYTIVTPPENGTLSGTAPNLTYNPNLDHVGPDSFTFKANDGTFDSNIATVSITVQDSGQGGGYNYAPGLVLTGSNYQEQPSSPSLQLSQFSVASWFKTSTDFTSEAFIVNKGGIGSDSAGQNQNYQISMTSSELIRVGFETSTGADQFVNSVNTYNDGQWHYAVVTNDGSTVRLYIDGVQVATKSTAGASPESSGTKPVRVGANSRVTPPGNFFTGEVDEVRVWNDDLTAQQVSDAFAGTSFNTGEQVLYLDFSSAALSGGYNYDPSLSLSGPGS